MRYAAGSLIALLVLSASATAAFAACKETEVPEIRFTDESRTQTHIVCVARSERETATPAPPSNTTEQPPSEAAPTNQSADPFTGTYEGSWFNVSGTKGWRVSTKVVFKRSLPDLVSLDYTEGAGPRIRSTTNGIRGTRTLSTGMILPREGNTIFHSFRNGDKVTFTPEEDAIRMERVKASGRVSASGMLWRVPENTPPIPEQLAPLKGVWSGSARSYSHVMEIDVFSEGPHFVVAVDYQHGPIGGWGGTGGRDTFIEHLGPEDPPNMRWWKTMDVVLKNESTLSIEYQASIGRYSATLKKEEPVSE